MQADELTEDLASLRISEPEAPSRKRWPLFAIAAGSLLAGSVLLKPHLEAAFFKTAVETTEILSLSPATIATEVTASGYVVPQRLSKIGSKVRGRIAEVAVAEGQRVSKGDVLIVLESREHQSAVNAGVARLAAAEARLAREKARLADLERRLAREKVLVAEGASGRAALEDLTAELRVLIQSVAAESADRAAVAAELASLRSTLAELAIRAPIDGTVLTKPPQIGELVSPSSAALMELADFASLMVEAEVPEARLAKVRIGGPCEIMLDAHPSRRFPGVVREISPVVNRAKASVVVRVAFDGAAEGVLPNMAARAFILEGEKSALEIGQPPKVVVPSSALVERSGARVVFIIDGDRVRMSPVQVGAPFGPGLELVDGPRVGTRLVKNPPATLSDGHRIEESKL